MPDAPCTPFDVVSAASGRVVRADKTQLLEAARRIESRALTLAAPVTMWVALQHARFLAGRTEWVYRTISGLGIDVHVYACGADETVSWPASARVHPVRWDDPLTREWTVLLLGPRGGLGFSARDRSRFDEPDDRRSFEWATTRDPGVIAAAAHCLAAREGGLLSSIHGASAV